MSLTNMFETYGEMVSKKLEEYVSSHDAPESLKESMLYSLLAGGKRIRPALLLEFYRILGGDINDVLNFACAIEMIHTYSLIHDDLPCMDDDDMRRGKPSNHIAFGEDIALLAGDALLTLAFEVASDISDNVDSSAAVQAINLIAKAAGMSKMVGGQVLDLESENKKISIETLEKLQDGKTVAMIKLPAQVACTISKTDKQTLAAAELYCENIGKAFQIRDDILDVIADEKTFGKPVGSDENSNKSTYVSLIGLEKSQKLVEKLSNNAVNAIKSLGNKCENLVEFSQFLCNRKI